MTYPLLHPKSTEPAPLSWSVEQFQSEFRESLYVELKTGLGAKPLRESVVAFANAEGGIVVIGVDDRQTVRGYARTPTTDDAIHEALRPIIGLPRYELHELVIDTQRVLAVVVWSLAEGIAQLPDGRVLRRAGTRDDALIGDRLVAFVAERATRRHQVEQQTTEWTLEDAEPELVERVERARGWKDWQARGLAERVGLARDGCLTVAGALFLRRDPDARLGRTYVDVLRFPSDVTSSYDLRRAFKGPIDEQIREVSSFVEELLGFEMAFQGVRRIELPRLPERVLREAIANAVAHRSYEQSGSCIEVELRPNRVVIRSPGGLPGGVTVKRLREEQHSRNPVIVEMLRHYELAEQRGLGIDLMEDAMLEAMLEAPRFIDHGHRFEVELPLHSTISIDERAWVWVLTEEGSLQPGDQTVLVHAMRGETLNNSRVRELLRTDERRARATLQRLCSVGLLEQDGTRGSARYSLAGDHASRMQDGLASDDAAAVIMRLAAERGTISNADVRAATGLDRFDALAELDRLVGDGRLVREGERRWVRYRPARR